MATRNSLPGAERVTMDNAGRFVVPPAALADMQRIAGPRVDLAAEIAKAEAWCAGNLRRKAGDHSGLLRSWLQRAADDARQQPPRLALVEGGGKGSMRGRAVLTLVRAAQLDGA